MVVEGSTGSQFEQSAQPAGEQQGAAQEQPAEQAPTPEPPTPEPTPVPQNAEVVMNDIVNVRSGPGTTYAVLGTEEIGAKFTVTAKSAAGDWWQIDYNGQTGWVYSPLVTTSNTEAVAVAQNIPPAPTLPPAPPPTDTPVPPPAEPQPAPTPQSSYFFNIVVAGNCLPQEAGNWFEGKTYVNGEPKSGYKVVFSSGPDGAWATDPIQSGPHKGYEGWNQGYYSHIINASGPQAGNWFVWVVDDGGQRISEIGNFQTNGKGGSCNQAIVDFDHR